MSPEEIRQLQKDAMVMALRLYGESYDTFAPETMEVMDRWRPKVEALLKDPLAENPS